VMQSHGDTFPGFHSLECQTHRGQHLESRGPTESGIVKPSVGTSWQSASSAVEQALDAQSSGIEEVNRQ
jgi:hypothetical protein